MKWILFLVMVTTVSLYASESCDKPSIQNHIYRNGLIGFTYPVPADYEASALELRNPDRTVTLLKASQQQPDNGVTPGLILVTMPENYQPISIPEHVRNVLNTKATQQGTTIIQQAVELTAAGLSWYRGDYNEEHAGQVIQHSFVSTLWKNHWLDWTFSATSGADLDLLITSLSSMTFAEHAIDAGVSGCVVPPRRVRVSQAVLESLLLNKVKPVPPDVIGSGNVVLQAVISKEGKVVSLRVVSGNPLLVPLALDAAKQFVYKPYVLNGEPVEVDSQITIEFKPTSEAKP